MYAETAGAAESGGVEAQTSTEAEEAGFANEAAVTRDSMSIHSIDGRASIEHLISIHSHDLFDCTRVMSSPFTLGEIMAGLRYIMHYRIRGMRMRNLDSSCMARLVDALLLFTDPHSTLNAKIANGEENESETSSDSDSDSNSDSESASDSDSSLESASKPTLEPKGASGEINVPDSEQNANNDASNSRLPESEKPRQSKRKRKRKRKLAFDMSALARRYRRLLPSRRIANDSLCALELFADFLEEVVEFRHAVALKPCEEIRRRLHLDRWADLLSIDKKNVLAPILVRLLATLPKLAPQLADWRDLVSAKGQSALAKLTAENPPIAPSFSALPGVLPFPPPALYFERTVPKLVRMFATNLTTGLSSSQIEERRAHYGSNVLATRPPPNALVLFLSQFKDTMIIILLLVAILEFALGQEFPGGLLLSLVLLNSIIGFWQEYRASRALMAIMAFAVPEARVLRDGVSNKILASELVPGDIILLEEGDSVPADVRIVDAAQLEIVESFLTGESVGVQKVAEKVKALTRRIPLSECKCNAFMSSHVTRGRGRAIVVRTGASTEIGRISSAFADINASSPANIQKKLGKLGHVLVGVTVLLCLLIFFISLARAFESSNGSISNTKITEISLKAVAIAVSAIPEGLVAIVTVTMTFAMRRMTERNALVRKLPAVEALGSVTTICSDKTGTLTEGKMGAQLLWTVDGVSFSISESTCLDPAVGKVSKLSPDDPSAVKVSCVTSPHKVHSTPVLNNNCSSSSQSPSSSEKNKSDLSHASVLAFQICSMCNNSFVARENQEATTTSSLKRATSKSKLKVKDESQISLVSLPDKTNTSTGLATTHDTAKFNSNGNFYNAVGDSTEVALVVAAEKAGLGRDYWENVGLKRLVENPFDSDRKIMSVLLQQSATKKAFVLAKGAPECILERSCGYMTSVSLSTVEGELGVFEIAHGPLGPNVIRMISNAAQEMASKGLRVLGLAVRTGLSKEQIEMFELAGKGSTINEEESDDVLAKMETDLVFVGLIGLLDPPRKNVKEAISSCHTAGIRVIMITGDHATTAAAIAQKLGILPEEAHSQQPQGQSGRLSTRRPSNPDIGRLAVRGPELDVLTDKQLSELKPFPRVFARVSPDHKLKIVRALQMAGHVVSMTGDGVNDAPAIRAADVGIAMGISGTDITKQAADMVLLDDDFSTIVVAVKEGRRVFDNIVKFIVYMLTSNSAEIWISLVCAIAGYPSPFSASVLLWANLFADVPPALALGLDPSASDIMHRPPRSPKANVLSKYDYLAILVQSVSMMTFSLILRFLVGPFPSFKPGNDKIQNTLTFASLTLMQLLQSLIGRDPNRTMFSRSTFSNKWLVPSVLFSTAVLVAGFYVPFMVRSLEFGSLEALDWVTILTAVVCHIIVSETFKICLRRWRRRKIIATT